MSEDTDDLDNFLKSIKIKAQTEGPPPPLPGLHRGRPSHQNQSYNSMNSSRTASTDKFGEEDSNSQLFVPEVIEPTKFEVPTQPLNFNTFKPRSMTELIQSKKGNTSTMYFNNLKFCFI